MSDADKSRGLESDISAWQELTKETAIISKTIMGNSQVLGAQVLELAQYQRRLTEHFNTMEVQRLKQNLKQISEACSSLVSPSVLELKRQMSALQMSAEMRNTIVSLQELVPSTEVIQKALLDLASRINEIPRTELLLTANHLSTVLSSTASFVDNQAVFESEDMQEISEDLTELMEDNENWNQRFMAFLEKVKQRWPAFALLFVHLILPIFNNAAGAVIGSAVVSAVLRDEPSSSAQIICHIEVNQEVIILGDEPYYYFVEVQEETSSETKKGYVSKRAVKPNTVENSTQELPK